MLKRVRASDELVDRINEELRRRGSDREVQEFAVTIAEDYDMNDDELFEFYFSDVIQNAKPVDISTLDL